MNKILKKLNTGIKLLNILKFKSFIIYYYLHLQRHLKRSKPILFRLKNGDKLFLDQKIGDFCVFNEVFIQEDYKFEMNNNNRILDIGANIGLFSLYAARINPNAMIYSFEPFPDTYNKLLWHIKENNVKNIKTYEYAISENVGMAKFYSIECHGCNTLREEKFDNDFCKVTLVKTITLTQVFEITGEKYFDIAKLDCEGAEYLILLNSPDLVLKKVKLYVIEVHDDKEYHPNDLINKFNELDYYTTLSNNILIARQKNI